MPSACRRGPKLAGEQAIFPTPNRRPFGTKNMKTVVLIVALAVLSVPAFARQPKIYVHGDSYYVAHKAQDRICVVFHREPKGAWAIVGTYKTLSQAAAAMKSAPDCVK